MAVNPPDPRTRHAPADDAAQASDGVRVDACREGRFSPGWWQAVRSDRRPAPKDLLAGAVLAACDLIPFRKDDMVVRASAVVGAV